MIVTLNDLKNYGLYDTLPELLKNLEDNLRFVFYYSVDEDNVKLQIYGAKKVKEVNVRLYQDVREVALQNNLMIPPKIGVFKNKFETRDGLFYQFLRSFNPPEKVNALIDFAFEQDKVTDLNVSTDAVNEINTSEDLKRVIGYFCPFRIQPIGQVFDMVNTAFKNKLSLPLYGSRLKKVVNLVKYDGGVLPEIGGTLRFMVIGENADLTDEQKQKLSEAKALVRSMESMDKIYMYTGWVLSVKDGKWRTNIADDLAKISPNHLIEHGGRKIYVPTGHTVQQMLSLLPNPNLMYALNYGGRLKEVLDHPTLFNYYPGLGTIPIFYYYGEETFFDQQGNPIEQFYYANNERGGYVVINGSTISGSSLSILLHETQHAIQKIENFATGGNELFARFVASVGSARVRQIFACINRLTSLFKNKMLNEQDMNDLKLAIKDEIASNQQQKQLKQALLDQFTSFEAYKDNHKVIVFYVILFVAEKGEYYDSEIVEVLSNKIGKLIYELFDNVSAGYDSAKKVVDDLSKQGGYRHEDIQKILFQSYENLYGEMESRSVQSSRFIESKYKNYYFLTTWEMGPIQQLVVIDGIETIIDSEKIEAAVETKEGEYVLHLQKTSSSVPILHELGHIVYDAMVKLGHEEIIKSEMKKTLTYRDPDEFFVDKFLAYLRKTINDEDLESDIMQHRIISESESINKILDDFFTDTEVSDRLKYLQTLLSMV